jgi:histidine triad (HIT) family protein
MDNCIFCKIVKREIPASIVYEDTDLLAFKDINPIDKVHLLIIPKEHIENLFYCKEQHKETLSKMMFLAPKLAKENGLEGFRTMINTGEKGGQEVFHIHFHVYGGSEKLAKI